MASDLGLCQYSLWRIAGAGYSAEAVMFPFDYRKSAQASDGSAAFWGLKGIVWVIACSSLVLLAAGLMSKISLGDEIHHYRFAKDCFLVKGRALFDAVYGSPAHPGFYYDTEFLWPFLLSKIWLLLGRISAGAAQIYQTCFYAALIFFTYLSGRKLYGERVGFWSGLIVAGMPMMASFGILFYMDLPMTAIAMAGFFFLVSNRYFSLGVTVGVGYLIKRSAVFHAPAIFLYVLYVKRKDLKGFFVSSLKVWVPAALIYFAENTWRDAHLYKMESMAKWIFGRMKVPLASLVKVIDYQNSSVLNPADVVKYTGVIFIAGIILYCLLRGYERKDKALFVFCGLFAGVTIFLRLFPDIRYLMPVFPLLAILSAKGISSWAAQIRWRQVMVVIGVFLQIIGVSAFTWSQRTIPAGIQEGFRFVKDNIPQGDYILYPETNLTEYTGRPLLWSRINIRALFWGSEQEKIEQILFYRLKFIIIKKARVYDDEKAPARHVGKYPLSFVGWLEDGAFVEEIFDNDEMRIYRVKPSFFDSLAI